MSSSNPIISDLVSTFSNFLSPLILFLKILFHCFHSSTISCCFTMLFLTAYSMWQRYFSTTVILLVVFPSLSTGISDGALSLNGCICSSAFLCNFHQYSKLFVVVCYVHSIVLSKIEYLPFGACTFQWVVIKEEIDGFTFIMSNVTSRN